MNSRGVSEIVEEAVRLGKVNIISTVSVGNITPTPSSEDVPEEDLVVKPKKYRNVPTIHDGIRFDSKKEAIRWTQLKLRERAGDIRDLKRQVPFQLKVGEVVIGKLILDLVYFDCNLNETVYEDVKSPVTITQLFKWKRKHFEAQYGFKITLFM